MNVQAMKFQVIKTTQDEPEYVLLPIDVFERCRGFIEEQIDQMQIEGDETYVAFNLADYVNPATQMRIEAGLTQDEIAKKMGVTQAYISKLENQEYVSPKALNKIKLTCGDS